MAQRVNEGDDSAEQSGSEIEELRAEVWLLRRDLMVLGPENARLSNALNAALAEIARLKAPKPKGRRGRPRKDSTGTYEEYLFRAAMEEVTASMRSGGAPMSERDAALKADALIRKDAEALQLAGLPGPFSGLATKYEPDPESVYNAFRRGKRAMGFARKRQTKK
jgi:hypothetical protein